MGQVPVPGALSEGTSLKSGAWQHSWCHMVRRKNRGTWRGKVCSWLWPKLLFCRTHQTVCRHPNWSSELQMQRGLCVQTVNMSINYTGAGKSGHVVPILMLDVAAVRLHLQLAFQPSWYQTHGVVVAVDRTWVTRSDSAAPWNQQVESLWTEPRCGLNELLMFKRKHEPTRLVKAGRSLTP